jgi:hypothetical protein
MVGKRLTTVQRALKELNETLRKGEVGCGNE